MCTSIVVNRRKTIVGWNLDLSDMEHRVRVAENGVFIEINDKAEGWMPLFGANSRGHFVGMPTCWPHDPRSDPAEGSENVIRLDDGQKDAVGDPGDRGDAPGFERSGDHVHGFPFRRGRQRAPRRSRAGV